MEKAVQVGPSHESNLGAATAVASMKAATTDDEAIGAARKDGSGAIKQVDKRSLDYILRSGLAGGMAGCAVSWPSENFESPHFTISICWITLDIVS